MAYAEKMRVFAFFTILLLPLLGQAQTVQIDLQHNGQDETWYVSNQFVRMEGKKSSQASFFDVRKKVLYTQHPTEERWVKMPASWITGHKPVIEAQREGLWEEQYGVMSQRWHMALSQGSCGYIFSNIRAAEMTGLTAADMLLIRQMKSFLQTGKQEDACAAYRFAPIQLRLLGLPMYWHGAWGKGRIDRIVNSEEKPPQLPKRARILDKKTHAQFLLNALPASVKKVWAGNSQNMPVDVYYKAVQRLAVQYRGVDSR